MTTNGGFIAGFSRSTQTSAYGGLLYLRKDILGAANSYNIGVAKLLEWVEMWFGTGTLT